MKRYTLLASAALLAMGAGTASADCADELAMMTGESAGAAADAGGGEAGGEAIVKDGSLAPLEDPADMSGEGAATGDAPVASEVGAETGEAEAEHGEQIVKDGSTAPLESEAGTGPEVTAAGSAEAIATSPQEVEAQQDSAAPESADASADADADRDAAIERARAALAAGDEQGCMDALAEARDA